jgi:hypothetical protein
LKSIKKTSFSVSATDVVAEGDVLLSNDDESMLEPKLEFKSSIKLKELKNNFLVM